MFFVFHFVLLTSLNFIIVLQKKIVKIKEIDKKFGNGLTQKKSKFFKTIINWNSC